MNLGIEPDPDWVSEIEAVMGEAAYRAMVELAQAQIVNIRQRVKNGIGLDDAPMPPYSEEYQKRKAASGRQAQVRDLLYSGKMLRSIYTQTVRFTETGVEAVISFSSKREQVKAAAHQRRARWFGVSRNDAKILEKVAMSRLQREISR